MRKILSLIMTFLIVASFAACKGKSTTVENNSAAQSDGAFEEIAADSAGSNNEADSEAERDDEGEDQTQAPSVSGSSQVQSAPQSSATEQNAPSAPEQKPSASPEQKPSSAPEQKPSAVPEQKPSAAPAANTLGQTLLADFKAKASSGMSTQAIAEALIANPAIKFNGGAVPVEEGYLSGFDNTEIKGFKSGVMIAPMIGSIAFVGYVFELESAADAPAFRANLEKSANLRWNICVEAEEMVSGISGNKVFFVMCPKSLEE